MHSPWHAESPMALTILLGELSPITFLFSLDIVLVERIEEVLTYVDVCIILCVY